MLKTKPKKDKKGMDKGLILITIFVLIVGVALLIVNANPSLLLSLQQSKTDAGITLPTLDPTEILNTGDSLTADSIAKAINKERAKANLSPLIISTELQTAANNKAIDTFSSGLWSENGSGGKSEWSFITNAGYQYEYAGLDMAKNFQTTSDVINSWMSFSNNNDRENILNSRFTDIGVAVKTGIFSGENTTIVIQYLASETINTGGTTIQNNWQNYGWYIHNGQSMQYVNGQWFSTPQQDNQSGQQNNSSNTNNSNSGLILCVKSFGTFGIRNQIVTVPHMLE